MLVCSALPSPPSHHPYSAPNPNHIIVIIIVAPPYHMLVADHCYADTLYINLAQHTETAVPALKGLFKHWWAEATWNCLHVIVFDNVDKLMGVELEVRFASFLYRIVFLPLHTPPLHLYTSLYPLFFFFPSNFSDVQSNNTLYHSMQTLSAHDISPSSLLCSTPPLRAQPRPARVGSWSSELRRPRHHSSAACNKDARQDVCSPFPC